MHWIAMLVQENPQLNPEQIQHIVIAMMALIPIFILIGIAIVMIPCWFILKKAGFSPWLCLLCLIPTLGVLVLLYVLAFAEWKVTPMQPATYYPPPPQQPHFPRA